MRFSGEGHRDFSPGRVRDDRLSIVIELIVRAPAYPLDELASQVHLSNSRLEHLFKRETGVSIRTFAVSLRLHRAATLLTKAAVPIKQAQFDGGFNHASNFSHLFRQHFGCNPSAYQSLRLQLTEEQKRPIECACQPDTLRLVLSAMRML
jgi:transcriptional regulator GlxA family with amidase domain